MIAKDIKKEADIASNKIKHILIELIQNIGFSELDIKISQECFINKIGEKKVSNLEVNIEVMKSQFIDFEKEENGLIYKIRYDLKSQNVTMFSVNPIEK